MERGVRDLAAIQCGKHEVVVAAAPNIIERFPRSLPTAKLPLHLNRRDPRLIWALRQELRKFPPDVVHAHGNKAAALVNLARFFLPRMARVATVHGTKRSTRVFAPYDCVIAVSRRAGEQLGRPHVVVWNGLAPARQEQKSDASGLPFVGTGKPLLLAVGRLVPVKGFDILIKALKAVDANLWLVGDGPDRAALEALARAEGVADRVWFAGFRDDVGRLMQLADMLVISSRYEGFPFVLVEILQRRRPVVATRVGGVEEVLPAKWLCDCENADALAELLNRAVKQRENLAAEFQSVFDIAERELTLESASRKVEAAYQDALAAAGTKQ
jgi:glycosyltransferase involved in cell wall biosynthesis